MGEKKAECCGYAEHLPDVHVSDRINAKQGVTDREPTTCSANLPAETLNTTEGAAQARSRLNNLSNGLFSEGNQQKLYFNTLYFNKFSGDVTLTKLTKAHTHAHTHS